MSQTVVVLDSSALIAHINGKDLWHKKADTIATFIADTERHVILPSEVFAETLNRLGVVFQTWIWMETMPCISKPSRSSSPHLKHYLKMRHSSHFERKSPCVS